MSMNDCRGSGASLLCNSSTSKTHQRCVFYSKQVHKITTLILIDVRRSQVIMKCKCTHVSTKHFTEPNIIKPNAILKKCLHITMKSKWCYHTL